MTTPTDAGNIDDVKKAKQLTSLTEKGDVAELRDLLRGKAFRRFFWNLLSDCGIYNTVMREDPYQMAFAEGTRNVGLKLINKLDQANPDAMIQMHTEFKRKA